MSPLWKCDPRCGPTTSQCAVAEGVCAEEEIWHQHKDHGLGSPDYGPDDPDCPCRNTAQQKDCAKVGCGFCRAAERP